MELIFEKLFESIDPEEYDTDKPDTGINKILMYQSHYATSDEDTILANATIRPKILAAKKKSGSDIMLDVDFIVPEIQPHITTPAVLTANVHICNRVYVVRQFLPSQLKKCYVVDSTPVFVPSNSLKISYRFPVPYLVFQTMDDCMYVYDMYVLLSAKLYDLLIEHYSNGELNFHLNQTVTIIEKRNIPPNLSNLGDSTICSTCGKITPVVTKGGQDEKHSSCSECNKEITTCSICDKYFTK